MEQNKEIKQNDNINEERLLFLAIRDLNSLRKNITMYPAEHKTIEDSLESAYFCFSKLFEESKEIVLKVAADVLIIKHYPLDKYNIIIKEFTSFISQRGIVSITFLSGLTKEELINFSNIIGQNVNQTLTQSKAIKLFKEKNIIHITIRFVDYEVEDDLKSAGSSVRISWDKLMTALSEGQGTGAGGVGGAAGQHNDIDAVNDIPPQELAQLVTSAEKEQAHKAIMLILSQYLKKIFESDSSGGFLVQNMLTFIDMLSDETNIEILTPLFKKLSSDPTLVEKVMNTLPNTELLNILKKYEGLIIGPLKGAIQQLASSEGNPGMPISERLDELLKSTSQNDYVDKLVTLDMSNLLQDIKENVHSEENAHAISEKLNNSALYMLEKGYFDEIYKIIDSLKGINKDDKSTQEIKKEFSNFVTSSNFIEKLLNEIKHKGRQNREDVSRLCQRLKKFIINPLIDELIKEDNAANRRLYLSILNTLGEEVAKEAVKRLDNREWFVVRNMIYLIRECGDEKWCTLYIKPFCIHKNLKIRHEAMKTLFHFNQPEGVEFLEKAIKSKDNQMRNMAVDFAGINKVDEVVPLLQELLDKKAFKRSDLEGKIPLIRALGKIGNSSALASLQNIINQKGFMYKDTYTQLKEEVYNSLSNYPYNDALPLLQKGLQFRNRKIQQISKRVIGMQGSKRNGEC